MKNESYIKITFNKDNCETEIHDIEPMKLAFAIGNLLKDLSEQIKISQEEIINAILKANANLEK